MSIVYQTDKRSGITYAYESKAYWDKEKKQSPEFGTSRVHLYPVSLMDTGFFMSILRFICMWYIAVFSKVWYT